MATINELAVEILTKIIEYGGVTQTTQLVCKMWNEVALEIIRQAYIQHKKRFAATLAEINTITYQYSYDEFPSIITNYRISKEKYLENNTIFNDIITYDVEEVEDYNVGIPYCHDVYDSYGDFCGEFYQITVASDIKKSNSVRQYKNKVSVYNHEVNQPSKHPVKSSLTRSNYWLDKYTMSIYTYYFETTENIENIKNTNYEDYIKGLKIQPVGPYYQYMADYETSDESELAELSELDFDDWGNSSSKIKYNLVYQYCTYDIQYDILHGLVDSSLVKSQCDK
ncbi:Hypothetical protein PACV_433 [Pacmanvirus A23]|uniref:Hypothetical protein n=1 Tax=Pacmanvirus A23 TaxID=1932881 RepID=UPI000A092007|nr:Hypothetical protein B9W72_gp429 [Pacmanvirus A23]SIP86146.1 Hypothetical protein PACV_433 [Pacmanvirus A23]